MPIDHGMGAIVGIVTVAILIAAAVGGLALLGWLFGGAMPFGN